MALYNPRTTTKVLYQIVSIVASFLFVPAWSAASSASATAGQSVTFSLSPGGSAPFKYQWYKNSAAISGATAATYTIRAVATGDTGNYNATVSNAAGKASSPMAALTVSAAASAPTILTQPVAVTVTNGLPITLTVVAGGSGPLSFQWLKNGANVSGATKSVLSISAAASSDAGSYAVKVSNSVGAVISQAVALTVSTGTIASGGSTGTAPTLVNNSFEAINVGTKTFVYTPAQAGWTFEGSSGISSNGSGLNSSNPSAPDKSQVAFLQNSASISTSAVFSAGTYTISADIANRAGHPTEIVDVLVDNAVVGYFVGGTNYTLATTPPFKVSAGTHSIKFAGEWTFNATVFLDKISVATATPSLVPSSGFENPNVGSGAYGDFDVDPVVVHNSQDWTIVGDAGITGIGTGLTSGNPVPPEGRQVAFIESNNGSISQKITFPTSKSYTLTVSAAKRSNYGGTQPVLVYLDSTYLGMIVPASGNYQVFTFTFSTTAGGHVVNFKGTTAQDCTTFLDNVQLK